MQTTDLKVNTITPALFKLAPDAAEMAKLDPSVIAAIIKPLGLSRGPNALWNKGGLMYPVPMD